MRIGNILHVLVLVGIVIFSYGFVDPNFPWQPPEVLSNFVRTERAASALMYSGFIITLFIFYCRFLYRAYRKQLSGKQIWMTILTSAGILVFSFPAFSYDIFNYIATAKVTYFYGENPYIVMPIEFPNEGMLSFMHAANKTALYGPSWIFITSIPHFLGFNNLYITIIAFKLVILSFYLLMCLMIWRLSGKNSYSLVLFALNPLVMVETLISSHNDVVMMFFALLAFYLIRQRIFILAFVAFAISVLVKYATIVLLPIFFVVFTKSILNRKFDWKTVWFLASICMFIPFLLSPLREEIYAWYLIWVITFVALSPEQKMLREITLAFSFGLLFRFAPFIYTREWGGITPLVKTVVTFTPPAIIALYRLIRR